MLFISISRLDLLTRIPSKEVGIELRLDLFSKYEKKELSQVLENFPSVIFTLRKTSQGGSFKGSESQREREIEALLELKPPYFDLEYDMRKEFLEKMVSSFPNTKFIISYHNFQQTLENLDEIFEKMKNITGDYYKIAMFATSVNDALRLILFSRKHKNLSVIPMGEIGSFGRVLGPCVGNFLNYSFFAEGGSLAPGQLTVEELLNIYHFSTLNEKTCLYGLIGDPVLQSKGHLYHNKTFEEKNMNAVYVKMRVTKEDLPLFFSLAKEVGFKGLSVTMPLKESVLPFVDKIENLAKDIHAVNTLRFCFQEIYATNTDGNGALDAIESRIKVQGKVVVLLGAGGAAKAIASEAIKRGAIVWVLNRTEEKAKLIALELGCFSGSLNAFPKNHDVVINCSPEMSLFDHSSLRSEAVVMDIVYVPKITEFLEKASLQGCSIVSGEEMFFNQAYLQSQFWVENL